MSAKKVHKLEKDDATGLWYAYEVGKSLGFGWRDKVIWLSYPQKHAYAEARKLGLIAPKKKSKVK